MPPPPPKPDVRIDSPANGASVALNQPLTVSGAVHGRLDIWIDGQPPVEVPHGPDPGMVAWSAQITPTALGNKGLNARSTILMGSTPFTKTTSIAVNVIDTTGPAVALVAPSSTSPTWTTSFALVVSASDPETAVTAVRYQWQESDFIDMQFDGGANVWRAQLVRPNDAVQPGGSTETVKVWAVNQDNAGTVVEFVLTFVDMTPPTLDFTPQDGSQLPGTANGADITVVVHAQDPGDSVCTSGLDFSPTASTVEVSIDGAAFVPAAPTGTGGEWSLDVHISAQQERDIAVRCTDRAGRSTTVHHSVVVVVPETIRDLSQQTYLSDLLEFATRRVLTASSGENVTVGHLSAALGQDLGALATGAATTAGAAVPELTVLVEALEARLGPAAAPAIAHWPLDEGAGTEAHDTASGLCDGTITAGTWTDRGDGVKVLSFDGAATEVDVAAGETILASPLMTLSGWVRARDAAGGNLQVVVWRENQYALARPADGSLQAGFRDGAGNWAWHGVATAGAVPAGAWHHVAAVFDETTLRGYVDGVPALSEATSFRTATTDDQGDPVRVGAATGQPGFFAGELHDVAVHDVALTPGEVAVLAGHGGASEVWLDDATPAGASLGTDADAWTWVTADPTPKFGDKAHQSQVAAGEHQHYFTDAGLAWPVDAGDLLYAWAFLDPANPPREVILQFHDTQDGWEHRAYWGEDLIDWGTAGTASRRDRGALPATGEWVRLEVPAAAVGLEGRVIDGLAFSLFDGRVTWDRSGRVSWRERVSTSGYTAAAYLGALTALGTSYEEVRLARGAAAIDRGQLADRLGLPLAGTRPDQLDALLLDPAAVTEEQLADLFGVPQINAPPAQQPSQLERWQEARARDAWRAEDHDPTDPHPRPVLDPDLIALDEVVSTAADTRHTWLLRAAWIDQQRSALATTYGAAADPSSAVLAVFHQAFGGPVEENLETDRDKGKDITAGLASAHLTAAAFDRLATLRALAALGPLRDDELDDLFDILVEVVKESRSDGYPRWVTEDRVSGLSVDPDVFVSAPGAAAPGTRWRAAAATRLDWQLLLGARATELADIRAGAQAAAVTAQTGALPLLVDALLAIFAEGAAAGTDVPDALTTRLFIDARATPTLATTRVDQALESVQGIVLAVRTGQIADTAGLPDDRSTRWELDPSGGYTSADFDEEWAWMSSYDGWRAAMATFLQPENVLLPTLLPGPEQGSDDPLRTTQAFQTFLTAVDPVDPTPDKIRTAAADYLVAVGNEVGHPALLNGLTLTDEIRDEDLTTLSNLTAGAGEVTGAASFEAIPSWLREVFYYVPLQCASAMHMLSQYLPALDWLRRIYAYDRGPDARVIFHGLDREPSQPSQLQRPIEWLLGDALNPHRIAETRANVHLRYVLLEIATCLTDFADASFALDTAESRPRARSLYMAAGRVLKTLAERPSVADPDATLPPNQRASSVSARAGMNLLKLRSSLDISGMPRPPDTALDGDVTVQQPTSYRYATLVARAQQLLTSATQVEAQYLAALEKTDVENYNLMKAGQDLELARQHVLVQQSQAAVADQEVVVAQDQRDRATLQRDTYDQWLSAGLNTDEQSLLTSYKDARDARDQIANLDAAITVTQAFTSAMSASNPAAIGAGLFGAAATGMLAAGRADATVGLDDAEYRAQVDAFNASVDRRQDEWRLQRALAEQDRVIGEAQIGVAQLRASAAAQEVVVAQTQQTDAEQTVNFLATKFTNAQLYEWMSGVLGRVYRYMLQQATAMARLAERQLAFERQETAAGFIKSDYWTVAGTTPAATGTDNQGLTGSARLAEDLVQLDQHAFETDRRKLQLAQTISLAALAPVDFQRFRTEGRLPFATPAALFDRAFPGHYLRTIRRVRVSVVGLVPPTTGVRASLWCSGISRVVVEGGGYSTVTVTRAPELISLTSPAGATGVFDLDPQSELMLPFEGSGLDTTWELRMPHYANPFDFRSLADVLITFEYTALYSDLYAQKVMRALPARTSNALAFSLRTDFPEAWYGLVSAARGPDATQPLGATWGLSRANFPPNLDGLALEQLALMILSDPAADGSVVELATAGLEHGASGVLTGASVDGLISTRTTTGSAWRAFKGDPTGDWKLSLGTDAAARSALASGRLRDLVLVVSYSGSLPAWGPMS